MFDLILAINKFAVLKHKILYLKVIYYIELKKVIYGIICAFIYVEKEHNKVK